MMENIQIIDDFLTPDFLDELLQSAFEELSPSMGAYPGKFKSLESTYHDQIFNLVVENFNIDLNRQTSKSRLRVTKKTDEGAGSSFVHVDPYDFVMILYLSKPPADEDKKQYGTIFWKLRLNNSHVSQAVSLKEKVKEDMVIKEYSKTSEAWEKLHQVDYIQNRAIGFSGSLYHSSSSVYFDNRITIDFFANYKTAQGTT